MNRPWLEVHDSATLRGALAARPPRVARATILLAAALLATATVWLATAEATEVVMASGRLRPVSPPTAVFSSLRGDHDGAGARVLAVGVAPGDTVRQGDVLLQLDDRWLVDRLDQAERDAGSAEAELVRLRALAALAARRHTADSASADADIERAANTVARAERQRAATLALAELAQTECQRDVDRLRTLVARDAAAHQRLLDAEGALQRAREERALAALPVDDAPHTAARHARALLDREFAIEVEEHAIAIERQRAVLATARAERDKWRRERSRATIHAPIDGVVVRGEHAAGDLVRPGSVVFELAATDRLCFTAEVANADVADLTAGMPVRIKIDALDHQRHGTVVGRIEFVAPDAGSRQAGDGGAAASFEVRVAMGEPARWHGGEGGTLRLGMTGVAEIAIERRTLGALLLDRVRRAIRLG